MKRRSFISLLGVAPLVRMHLGGQESGGVAVPEWGPPLLKAARGEHLRVILSFTPVAGATSYQVRYGATAGAATTLEGVLATDYAVLGLKNGTEYRFSVAAVGPRGTTAFSNERRASPTAQMDWKSLAEAFVSPNPTRSSCPFWMLHGDESDEELRQFMELAYHFGFEGVTLHPYDYQGFLEEGMWKRWRVILDQARKWGLVLWQQDDKDYPSGYAGGKIVAKDRTLARWEVTLPHRERHQGPKPLTLKVNAVLPAKQRLVAVSAFGPKHRIEDLSDLVANGQLRWDVPEGEWEICVTAAWQPGIDDPPPQAPHVVRGVVRGYIDPLSPVATERYVETIYGATVKELGAELNPVWKGWFIDEPAFYSSGTDLGRAGKGYPYTPDLVARCNERYGYSTRALLPLLWLEHGPRTVQFRRDYLDFVSGEFARLFLGKITQFCEAHGMQLTGHGLENAQYHLGYGSGSIFRTVEALSMGGFDNIFDQWYLPDEDCYWRQPKMASSISHYKQTPQDEATVEHFAATGWRTGLTEMKAMIDWTTCRGLNHIVPCGLDTQDPPDWEDQPEFWLHGRNPLAPYFPAYQAMVNRETMMIRGGRHVAKALILDTAESAWMGWAEEVWKVNKALSQAHLDYDDVSYDFFGDPARCRIADKRLHLGQEEYEVAVLPGVDAIPIGVLRRLHEFYEAGGTVIMVGPGQRMDTNGAMTRVQLVPRLPIRSTDGQHGEEVKDLVERLWGSRASGRGRAYLTTYKDIKNLLYSLDLHDVWIDPNLSMLQYYHRRLSGRDLYFFNNEGETVHTTVHLRGAQGVPEFWDPVTATIRQVPCYAADDQGIQVRLDLERYESVFVVLNPSAQPLPHLTNSDADEVRRGERGQIVVRKYTPGSVQYTLARPDGRIEEKRIAVPVKGLSPLILGEGWFRTPTGPHGAIYKIRFDWPFEAPLTATLVIDDMTQALRVKLNGNDLGLRFTYPFRFDLSAALLRGPNELELEHTERYLFGSKLGSARILAYAALEI